MVTKTEKTLAQLKTEMDDLEFTYGLLRQYGDPRIPEVGEAYRAATAAYTAALKASQKGESK